MLTQIISFFFWKRLILETENHSSRDQTKTLTLTEGISHSTNTSLDFHLYGEIEKAFVGTANLDLTWSVRYRFFFHNFKGINFWFHDWKILDFNFCKIYFVERRNLNRLKRDRYPVWEESLLLERTCQKEKKREKLSLEELGMRKTEESHLRKTLKII